MPKDQPSARNRDQAAQSEGVIISKPRRYMVRMGLFLGLVFLVMAALAPALASNFMANPALNGLIFGALILGVLYAFRQVLLLRGEAAWLLAFQQQQARDELGGLDTKTTSSGNPVLLAPMNAMLKSKRGSETLSALSTRSILDSVAARLDEARDISRYMIGLLIFLGLLGTFWGLLQTIAAVGDTIGNLTAGSGDTAAIFEDLKAGLAAPLDGMGTAFSSSLFGLAGSLVLGFLDLQVGGAQNRFYNELEEWLSSRTRLTSGGGVVGDGEGGASVPAYVSALLEQTADGLENLQRTLARTEERRLQADRTLMDLGEKMALLADKLTEPTQNAAAVDEVSRRHLTNIDAHLGRLLEETAQGRADGLADLRADIRLLTRTVGQLGNNPKEGGNA
ncbi:MAG: flagellar motor protein MotA [Alphaproteobacteria bacterium]